MSDMMNNGWAAGFGKVSPPAAGNVSKATPQDASGVKPSSGNASPLTGPAQDTVQLSNRNLLGTPGTSPASTANLVAQVGKMSLSQAQKELNPSTFAAMSRRVSPEQAGRAFSPIEDSSSSK